MSRGLRLIPILVLALLVLGLAWRLVKPPDPAVPSQMVLRSVPQFDLPAAVPGKAGLKTADLTRGGPQLVNVFASWCVPCAAEAPVLRELKQHHVRISAIAVRDTPEGITAFLAQYGDPYEAIGSDPRSSTQIDFGSSGVPETFVVDAHGVIRRQYIGPLTEANIAGVLREIGELQ